ncbi:MAG: hypothetical protein QF366_02750 [Candidatus Poseidoniia archaeon]|nr:hypothetical protein [Candidatus Poseidoniia archaeon]
MFGVVACPKCRSVRSVELAHRSAGCQRCGYRMVLTKVRIWERCDSQPELAGAIARVRNELAAPVLRAEAAPSEAPPQGDMRTRLLAALPDGEIEEEALLARARAARIPEERAREMLAALLADGTLCEPRPGWLAKV